MASLEELEKQAEGLDQFQSGLPSVEELQKSLPSISELEAMINMQTQETLARFRQQSIAEPEKEFEIPIAERNAKDGLNLGDYARAGFGGFADVFASTAEGLATVSGNRKLANSVARTRDQIDEAFTGDIPDELKQNFGYKVANAIGMMPGYVLMALGTGGTGLVVKGASWLGLASNAYQQGVDDYVASTGDADRDLTESEFAKARQVGAMTTVPIMLLERLGGRQVANAIFRGADNVTAKTALGRLASFGKAPTSEAITEGLQTFSQNYIAKEIASFDPDRKLDQGIVESMLLGGIASGTYSVPAQLMAQHDRLSAGIQNGEINPEELNSDLGRQLMSTAMDNEGVPHIDLEEGKKMHDSDSFKGFINDVLVPLSSKIGKAGAGKELQNAFRQFERENAVQQGRAEQLITPFLNDLQNLKKKSPEDYEALADALANASLLNKTTETELVSKEDPNEVAPNDVVEVDSNMPVGETTKESFVQGGVKTEINRRGLTQEEVEQGIDPKLINEKFNLVKKTVDNAKLAMSETLPNVTFGLYKTNQQFKDATGIQDDVKGAYVNGKIYINSELADPTTVGHEVFHALFLQNTGEGQVAYDSANELLNTVLRSTTNEELKSYITGFASNYDANIQSEESLAQMFGVMSGTYGSLDISTKTKIKAWFSKVAKALGIDGVFTQESTDAEIINGLNAMAQGVARGESIAGTSFKIPKISGNDIDTKYQARFQAGYVDERTNFVYGYLKNQERFTELIKGGRITKNRVLGDFNVPMLVHRPDNFFTGDIKYNDETLVEGTGGIFFPANNDLFWAGSKGGASTIVNRLNEQIDNLGSDKVRMLLVSAPLEKSESNSEFAKGVAKVSYRGVMQTIPQKYRKQFETDFRKALLDAESFSHDPKKKPMGSLGIDYKNDSIENIFAELDAKITADKTFDQRKSFARGFVRSLADKSKYSAKEKGQDKYNVVLQESILGMLASSKYREQSAYFTKRKRGSPHAPNAEYMKGFQAMFSEPLLRDFDSEIEGELPTDHAYAVIEMDGKVESVDLGGDNSSYTHGIQSVSGNKPTIHLLKDRASWDSFYQYKGFHGDKTDKLQVMPSGGLSTVNFNNYNNDYKKFELSEDKIFEGMFRGTKELEQFFDEYQSSYQTDLRLQRVTEFQFDDQDAINALPKKEKAKYNRHKTDRIPMGAVRLNLGSMFEKAGVPGKLFVQTLHPVSSKTGKANYGVAHSYGRAFTIKDATFAVNPLATALIKNKVSDKFPMASVNGRIDYEQEGSLEGEVLSFNPFNNVAFVDSQGRFVKSVEEATVYGSKVYARGRIEYMEETPESVSRDEVAEFLKGKRYVHPVFHPKGIVAGQSIKNKQEFLSKHKEAKAEVARRKQAQTADILRMQKSGKTDLKPKIHSRDEYEGILYSVMVNGEKMFFEKLTMNSGNTFVLTNETRDKHFYIGRDNTIEQYEDTISIMPDVSRKELLSELEEFSQTRFQKAENETYEQVRDRILAKHNMGDNFKIVSDLLQNLYDGGRSVNMDVGYLENFFPRLVKDVRGLQDSYTGVLYDTEIQRELDAIEQRRGKTLDGYERQSIIENIVKRKSIKMSLGGMTPGNIKERTIEVIDSERRNKYYASPEEALVNYAQSMIASINQAKLLGTTNRRKGEVIQGGRLAEIINRNLEAGTISNEGLRIIQDAVDARFGRHGKQSSIIKGLKNAGYIATMGNVGSAVTQLGDFYFTGVQTGVFNTIAGFAKTLASKDRITREDVMGARNVVTIEAQEGAGALANAVDWFFKASGITQIDALAKNTNINANYTMMRKAVRNQNSKEYKKLFNELVKTQGMRDASKAISDLRSGIKSDQVLQALFNRLSDVAPISLIEMPQAYAENPNTRILYSLKSYTIKQFDFLRQQSFQKMANKNTFTEGFTNLFRIGMLAMLANGSADVLKAILFNREIDEEDLVFNNILRIFGVTKYTTVKARKEGIGEALISTVAPPQLGILNDLSQDVVRAIDEGEIDIDELRSVKYIPLVGKLYYWREGRGVGVEERLSRLRD